MEDTQAILNNMVNNNKSNKSVREAASLLQKMVKESNLNRSILNLAKIEDNSIRLHEMLEGLGIGSKRKYDELLEDFIDGNDDLTNDEQKACKEIIKEHIGVIDSIEEVITKKLGIDKIKKAESISKDNLNNFNDFEESFVDLGLYSTLESINNSHNIIQDELNGIDVAKPQYFERMSDEVKANEIERIDNIENVLDRIEDTSVDWLKCLKSQKENHKFDLTENDFYALFNETIVRTKKTLEQIEITREKIDREFPERIEQNPDKYEKDNENKSGGLEDAETHKKREKGEKTFQDLKVKRKKRYEAKDIDIDNVDEIHGKRALIVNFERRILDIYRNIPEDWRDIIEEAGKNGFSNNLGYVVAGAVINRLSSDDGEMPGPGTPPPPPPFFGGHGPHGRPGPEHDDR